MKVLLRHNELLDISVVADVVQRFGLAGVEISTDLASSLACPVGSILAGSDLLKIRPAVELAASLNCPAIQLPSDKLFARDGIASASMVAAMLELGDIAAEADICLLIQNQATSGAALRLWKLLDRLNHPSIGCSWDTLAAARAGDVPAVAVPLLNSRIWAVCLQDAGTERLQPGSLGQGQLPLRKTIERLRGIGFDGTVSIGTAHVPGPAELDQALGSAVGTLTQWLPGWSLQQAPVVA